MNESKVNEQFQAVRQWSDIRDIGGAHPDPQVQTQRMLQEAIEVHDAVTNNDREEIMDACGDTVVTLVNLCKLYDFTLEEALEAAFSVIKYRKGITTPRGDFIRYGKLSNEDKEWCDVSQGSPGEEYFTETALESLTPPDFVK